MKRWILFLTTLFGLLALTGPSQAASLQSISAPVLKWQRGGCFSTWCQTSWYASPAVADLDNDGNIEVISGMYSLFILNGASGTLKVPEIDTPGGRIWPDIALADLEGDGDLEIVIAQGDGYLSVYNHNGTKVWEQNPTTNEFRSLGVYDIDNNGDLEILSASTDSENQWYVYEHTGSLRTGWPQRLTSASGYAAGCYNQNLAAADLTGDGLAEIIGPSDVHYINAFHSSGAQVSASSLFGSGKYWSQVGVNVDQAADIRGWTDCENGENRPNFANSAPTISDLDGNGTLEIVVVGNVYSCDPDLPGYVDLYEMPFIFNPDRTRWAAGAYDWTVIPTPDASAAPLSENWEVIETSLPNPVLADLDSDGKKEILYSSYDGRVHAYWLDKTEHGSWPYSVYNPADGYITFASPPAVADLDNNGQAEVIFTTWVQKDQVRTGKLIILSSQGVLLQSVSLPAAYGATSWNGALAAPTLANIDSDADLEVVINSVLSGVLAYDLPGTANARILWGTGRGNYYRSGSPVLEIKAFLPMITR